MGAGKRDAYLVGSIPLTRPYDVFTSVADILGEQIARVPDGEIGDRGMWVQSQWPVLVANAAIAVGAIPEGGPTRKTGYQIPVSLRAGIAPEEVEFAELGYAKHALASYAIFRALKQARRIPQNWRLQVALPLPMDVMTLVEPASRGAFEPRFEQALVKELDRIQAGIPHAELAVVWDAVQGVLTWEQPENRYVTLWFDDWKQGIVDRFERVARRVARDVELGLHLCYGSQDHQHALQPRDLGACVGLANAVAARLARPIDFVHMPVPRDRKDDAYFEPLRALNRAAVKNLYLGLVHYTDGVAGTRERIAVAERISPDFGIATECGFGRRPAHQDIVQLLRIHADAA
jgi:hypothetical protein